MSQTLFDAKGTTVPSKCIDCGVILGNYSLWFEGEGPLCYICNSKRLKDRGDIPGRKVNSGVEK